jgi:periplasmic divalent cation tolerance protein
MIYVFWTCRTKAEAKKIIHGLLDQHLIACASVLPEVESTYRWQGRIEENTETKVILKTTSKQFAAIRTYIEERCSYQVPEILQVDVT